MGLKKATTFKSIQLTDAYYRVVLPQIDTSKTTMSFSVWVFSSEAGAMDQENALGELAEFYSGVPYAIAGENPFSQAYAYLKTLLDFAGAVNVFEAGQPS
ncbi:hypothetical protein [Paraburkholderia fynbosensis]|uniref:Uncharacterized protein n=1 Tax=Paraburkholderia fynbosensis TaxID=1200993 RepID=A0A6J5FPQ2_9BURK|nr:hypothetical protein [Paraburkholderia fynbosensis]CAB3782024.1 hypothetical protein LMG27177_01147 [Paraburkholderia fynbosensis]